MSEKERREFSASMKEYAIYLSKNKEASKDFLVRVGIITPKGNFRKPYRHLCIPSGQD